MATAEQRNSYDEVPYPDLCYHQTHPGWMEILGQLLGMSPAPAEKCRVLEIGTASGGNILPMAAVLPNSTFVGMDYSIVQIERGQAVINETGLSNISLQHMDIMDITPEYGQFDYIIVHGIYSWVPPAVQDKLMEICKHNLAPQGIAYVSYNTYPGWHMMDIVRNQMLYRTRHIPAIADKLEPAREWISFMAHTLANHSDSAYASVFESYLAYRTTQALEMDPAAQLHDELEANNMPLYFHQFVERAEQHGLQYLVESDFQMSMGAGLTKEVLDQLKTIARTTVEMEQYFDFVHNRTFRRTLLCHSDVQLNRQITTQPMRSFYVSCNAQLTEVDAESAAKGIDRYVGTDGSKFATNHPLTKAAFQYLIESAPLRTKFDDLVHQAQARLTSVQFTDEDTNILAGNLLRAFSYSKSLIQFDSFTPQMTTTVSDRPLATSLVRHQARHSPEVVNLLHLQTKLNNFTRLVLTNLDGENNRDELLDFLVRLVQEGKITRPNDDKTSKTTDELRQSLSGELDAILKHLASLSLLVS